MVARLASSEAPGVLRSNKRKNIRSTRLLRFEARKRRRNVMKKKRARFAENREDEERSKRRLTFASGSRPRLGKCSSMSKIYIDDDDGEEEEVDLDKSEIIIMQKLPTIENPPTNSPHHHSPRLATLNLGTKPKKCSCSDSNANNASKSNSQNNNINDNSNKLSRIILMLKERLRARPSRQRPPQTSSSNGTYEHLNINGSLHESQRKRIRFDGQNKSRVAAVDGIRVHSAQSLYGAGTAQMGPLRRAPSGLNYYSQNQILSMDHNQYSTNQIGPIFGSNQIEPNQTLSSSSVHVAENRLLLRRSTRPVIGRRLFYEFRPERNILNENKDSIISQRDEMEHIKSNSINHHWNWNENDKSHECYVSENKLDLCFHPKRSDSAAAIRGSSALIRNGNYYYWEVKVFEKTYGTSMMFGICTKDQTLHINDYCNLIGLDNNGWSLSHKGLLWHGGKLARYTDVFPENQSVTIGILFNTMRGELSYFMNGQNLGVAFKGLNKVKGELYPVVGSTAKSTRMRLVGSYCGHVSLLQRSCFTILNSASDKIELIDQLSNYYRLPKILTNYLAEEAEIVIEKPNETRKNHQRKKDTYRKMNPWS